MAVSVQLCQVLRRPLLGQLAEDARAEQLLFVLLAAVVVGAPPCFSRSRASRGGDGSSAVCASDLAATAGDEDDAVLEAGIGRSGSGSHSGSQGGQRLLLMELRERRGGWRGQCNSARSSAGSSSGSLPRMIMPST